MSIFSHICRTLSPLFTSALGGGGENIPLTSSDRLSHWPYVITLRGIRRILRFLGRLVGNVRAEALSRWEKILLGSELRFAPAFIKNNRTRFVMSQSENCLVWFSKRPVSPHHNSFTASHSCIVSIVNINISWLSEFFYSDVQFVTALCLGVLFIYLII